MRIAFCFSGHLREYQENNSVWDNLIAHNIRRLRASADVFVHTYRVRNAPAGTTWHQHNAGADEPVTLDDEAWIEGRCASVGAWLSSFELDAAAHGGERMPEGCEKMGQRWSLHRSWAACERFASHESSYDLVVQTRWDVIYEKPVNLPLIVASDEWCANFCENALRRGVDSDVFCYGSQWAYGRMMGELIPMSLRLEVPGYGFVGEKLATAIRELRGLRLVMNDVPLLLRRPGGFLDRVR